mgnify:FL=1
MRNYCVCENGGIFKRPGRNGNSGLLIKGWEVCKSRRSGGLAAIGFYGDLRNRGEAAAPTGGFIVGKSRYNPALS